MTQDNPPEFSGLQGANRVPTDPNVPTRGQSTNSKKRCSASGASVAAFTAGWRAPPSQ